MCIQLGHQKWGLEWCGVEVKYTGLICIKCRECGWARLFEVLIVMRCSWHGGQPECMRESSNIQVTSAWCPGLTCALLERRTPHLTLFQGLDSGQLLSRSLVDVVSRYQNVSMWPFLLVLLFTGPISPHIRSLLSSSSVSFTVSGCRNPLVYRGDA
ncbi:hypothetical protein BGW80DRAFT_561497 [Lactifluus volemus]|jgi:hypothetical protein|nr:hypothetical protein BGW80DRAFT_561497 [Lactifluus volemus]